MFDPYGKVTVLDGNGTPRTVNESLYGNTRFHQGLRLDTETGLYYNRARMLDPVLGRFIGRDPIDAPENWHQVGAHSEALSLRYVARDISLRFSYRPFGTEVPSAQRRVQFMFDSPLYNYVNLRPSKYTDPSGYAEIDHGIGFFCKCNAGCRRPPQSIAGMRAVKAGTALNANDDCVLGEVAITTSNGQCGPHGSYDLLKIATFGCEKCADYTCKNNCLYTCRTSSNLFLKVNIWVLDTEDDNCP
jgi:RHS repeat-associated protein